MPVLSVLTAAHGPRSDYLVEAGESLAVQRVPAGWDVEWIVQEDGPAPALAGAVARFPFARYQAHGEQLAAATTRNLGLTRAAGDLVHVLDSDDVLLPGALATAIDAFTEHPQIHWVAGRADD